MSENFLSLENIYKSFRISSRSIPVLQGVSLEMKKGEFAALLGASGSGKTTLLDIAGTISRPDCGEVLIDGIRINSLSPSGIVKFRRKRLGFVFQSYHILPELSILENVMLPGLLDGISSSKLLPKAKSLLEQVGLASRMNHRSNELSGGEQQRTAFARALINDPDLLLADEPTGNLDSITGNGIMDLFREVHRNGVTILMVTHDAKTAAAADRAIVLKDGKIAEEHPTREE